VATLTSFVIMQAHAQAAYQVRVPRWLLMVTFVSDNSIVDTPDKGYHYTMPLKTAETKVCLPF
jgi:hypothetical protein